jgi:hypothetical protein
MPEVDIGKYNTRIQALEKLRQEALADLCGIEDDMGIGDQSLMESVERKEISPAKIVTKHSHGH